MTEFVVLLSVAAIAGTVLRRLPIPPAVVLAVVGLLAGLAFGPLHIDLSPRLLLFVILPGLLFEAAFNLRGDILRTNLAVAITLATGGVLVTTVVAGLLGHWVLGLSIPLALIFGAVVSPTDPVSVLAVFRRLGVPSRLANLVEAESLFNDGTGAVLFTVAVAAAGAGGLSLGSGALELLRLAGGGCALGLAIGFVLSRVTIHIDDVQVEITLTAVAAYGGYLLADSLGTSGILCVVMAGLVLGNYGRPRGMSARTQHEVGVFWDYVTFLLNTAVFLIIGLDVPRADLLQVIWLILPSALVVLLARAVSVYGLLALLRPFHRSVGWRWQHLITWSGLRGAVAIALLLTLTGSSFARLRGLVYGTVLLSLVVQGTTMGPLAGRLLHRRMGPPAVD